MPDSVALLLLALAVVVLVVIDYRQAARALRVTARPARHRQVVCVGWDAANRPRYRYLDEILLPDAERSIVDPEDRPL